MKQRDEFAEFLKLTTLQQIDACKLLVHDLVSKRGLVLTFTIREAGAVIDWGGREFIFPRLSEAYAFLEASTLMTTYWLIRERIHLGMDNRDD